MGDPVTIIAGVASIAGGVAQAKEKKTAAKREKKARRVQAALGEAQAQRERRETVRQSRIQRAQILNQGEIGGVAGSSGVQGGVGSVQSQAASNIGFQQQQLAGQRTISDLSQGAADARSRGSTFGAIGGVANQAFEDRGGFKSIFKGFF